MKKKKSIIFLKGKKVILRPPDKRTDLENAVRWMNDLKVTKFLTAYLPSTISMEEEWFDNIPKNMHKDIVFSIDTLDGRHIGFMGIHDINWKDRFATTGAVIGEKRYWNRGYGTDAKMLLLHYAFHTLGLHKINSNVYEFNPRSLAYSLHCGYKKEGRRKEQIFREGKRCDVIELGILRRYFEPFWKKYFRKS